MHSFLIHWNGKWKLLCSFIRTGTSNPVIGTILKEEISPTSLRVLSITPATERSKLFSQSYSSPLTVLFCGKLWMGINVWEPWTLYLSTFYSAFFLFPQHNHEGFFFSSKFSMLKLIIIISQMCKTINYIQFHLLQWSINCNKEILVVLDNSLSQSIQSSTVIIKHIQMSSNYDLEDQTAKWSHTWVHNPWLSLLNHRMFELLHF